MDRRSFLKSAGAGALAASAILPLSLNAFSAEAAIRSADTTKLFKNTPQLTQMRGFGGQDIGCDNALIEGKIPAELRGVFYRNGPGLFERGAALSALV